MPKQLTLALTALLTLLLLATPAQAGTYTVYSCKTPSGRWVGSEGWVRASSPAVLGYDSGSLSDCEEFGDGLRLELGGEGLAASPGAYVGASFTAPLGTSITAFQMYRAYRLVWPVEAGANRPYSLHAWHGANAATRLVDFQSPTSRGGTITLGIPGFVEKSGVNWDSVTVSVECWGLSGTGDCGGAASSVSIPRTLVQLTDPRAPTVGVACCSAVLRGAAEVAYSAQDVGSGIHRARIEIDGRTVAEAPVSSAGETCEDVEPENGDPLEFATPLPCPTAAEGEIVFDTNVLRDGAHILRFTVDDASGNRSTAVEKNVSTHNAPVATGQPQINGSERIDALMWIDPGQWDGTVDGLGYRWLRCDGSGGGCAPILGADGAEYRAGAADVYHRLVGEVTAGNGSGSTVARSEPSEVIADGDGNTSPPASPGGGSGAGGGRDRGSGGGGGTGGGGGGDATATGSGGGGGVAGIPSLQNPLGEQPGRTPNGTGASSKVKLTLGVRRAGGGTARRVLGSHTRKWGIAGRLLNSAGKPIVGARINLLQRVSGRRWVARRGFVRTRADGRFSATLPGGPSRTVRATYFPFGDSDAFRASNAVAIDVLAPLTIATDRRVVGGRRVVTIRGRAAGGSIPRSGLLVTLQGYQAGFGWRTFRTLRSNARGSWRASYRFRATSGRFAFRALVPRQGSYPYATTVSHPVAVTVR